MYQRGTVCVSFRYVGNSEGCKKTTGYVRFQALMVATMKMTVFWDVVLYSLIETGQCLRGAYCLHHQAVITLSTSETLSVFYETTWHNIPKTVIFSMDMIASPGYSLVLIYNKQLKVPVLFIFEPKILTLKDYYYYYYKLFILMYCF
jgi:hypothetical protein